MVILVKERSPFKTDEFLASQDALQVMGVTHWLLADLTDVTLVSDDTYREDEEDFISLKLDVMKIMIGYEKRPNLRRKGG